MRKALIELVQGDITRLEVDAIVNAANSSLQGGGGVDGAIHRAAGPALLEECRRIRERQGGCPAGQAVLTGAGNLKARCVIHTVGPVWQGGEKSEDALLASCYANCLRLAVRHAVRTIAFPNVSTGIYGFPKERAAGIAVREVRSFVESDATLERVIFVSFDPESYALYQELLSR